LFSEILVAASVFVWLPFYFNIVLLGWGLWLTRRLDPDPSKLHNDPKKFIIQVCTSGKAPKSVNSIFETIGTYDLEFPYETWVVIEEYDSNVYRADRVVKVPADFVTPKGSGAKARALEYAREVRIREGIEVESTKILFLDDDSFPERGYVEYAFHTPVEIAHGYIRTDREYGTNLLTSVADNFRVSDCIATCPTFATLGKPKLIHGEGLVAKGNVEREITWDHGGPASWGEDLMFGTEASHQFTYGFIPHSIHIASPFTVHDLYKQRRRWLWGSLKSLPLLSRSERAFILARLYCGFMAIPSVVLSAYSAYAGVKWPLPLQIVFSCGTVSFVGYYMLGAWLNTHHPKRMIQTLILFIPAALLEAPVLLYSLLRQPKTFEVIRKE
jgi:cellulose synthase/poly-beta-1,6-N-acetylglucosamine synthase-like glycosyltransferase